MLGTPQDLAALTVTLDLPAEEFRSARRAIGDVVRSTPVWPLPALDAIAGVRVWLKCEQLQLTGSFKIRGALNFVRRLEAAPEGTRLVAASAGNHAQGVAYAAAARGFSATVVMPAAAPLAKVTATRMLGATVVLHGASLEDAREKAAALAAETDAVYVPPFDDPRIVAGQGTIGLELLEQLPDVAEILVPAGGGGLLAGVAAAVKNVRPSVRVIGVQARAMDGILQSLSAGRLVSVPAAPTIADGVAVAGPSDLTFALISRYADDVVSVGEDAIAHAIVLLLEQGKVLTEGAGALGVAAVQSGSYRPRGDAVAVLSGGNIDINLLGAVVRHGLVEAGRYRQLSIEVVDSPGELALVSQAIADAGGNILEVEHVREAPDLPIGVAVLAMIVEVNGADHYGELVASLGRRGVLPKGPEARRLATADARSRHRQG